MVCHKCATEFVAGATSGQHSHRPTSFHVPTKARRSTSVRHLDAASIAAEPIQETRLQLGADVRSDFPILHQHVNGKPLVYFDNSATSQKPSYVIDALDDYYHRYNSNVHRGVHHLASQATMAYEDARDKVARLINARSSREVVYTKNATEAINLVAYTWAQQNLTHGDEVVVSVAEHHANLVPWQEVCRRTGAQLKAVPLTKDTQELDMQALRDALSARTRLVALVHVSNMTAAGLPTDDVVAEAHKVGAKVLLDACQSVPNMPVDVRALGVDWLVASAHKMCGPTGIGFLWGRYELLEAMPPFLTGGEMIENVFLDHSTYAPPPSRFEAGTPAIAEAIGLGAAVDYLQRIGLQRIAEYEEEVGGYLHQQLSGVDGVTIYGPPPGRRRAALAAFNVEGLHATDVSTLLDNAGVAVRSGHHCTQPLHAALGLAASARASPYFYNTFAEVDTFIAELRDCIRFFRELG